MKAIAKCRCGLCGKTWLETQDFDNIKDARRWEYRMTHLTSFVCSECANEGHEDDKLAEDLNNFLRAVACFLPPDLYSVHDDTTPPFAQI